MNADATPDHLLRPHLRPIQPIPVSKDGKQFVALRDPLLATRQSMIVAPQMMPILQQLRGESTIEELAARFKVEVPKFVELVEGLDKMGLLWGPTFEKYEQELRTKLVERGTFPPRASGTLGEDADACRRAIDEYYDQTEDPEIDETAVAIVAPHLDYGRGWPNYAAAYRCLANTERPDRVVILGTNHFGLGDGVVMSQLGVETPLGTCPADTAITSTLVERLGSGLVVDQLDHMPEHSIELQVPWIQHRYGDVPMISVLVPDPITPMIEDDGARVATDDFIRELRTILDDVGGRTLFVASSDLSHVGPQFGEPRPVDDQRRLDVEKHDREMLAKFITGDAEEFLGAMRWNKNPTRWCSIGNMSALLALGDGADVELIDYRQAYDDRGAVMVTSAALALVEPNA